MTAANIINMLPCEKLHCKSPFEVLFGENPLHDHMRIFDCLCYMTNNSPTKSKFDSRAFPCVFLGYPFGKKAYKVFDLKSHKVYFSRDVVFHEDIFLFQDSWNQSNNNNESPLLVPLTSTSFDFDTSDIRNDLPSNKA